MATYQPPTENLIDFNSSVFKTANESTLTLSEAQALFLARVGTASSTAISTSFTNDIFVNDVRAGTGKYRPATDASMNTCFGRNALGASISGIMNTAVGNTALAALNTGSDNTAVGNKALNSLTTGIRNVAVGANSLAVNSTGQRNTAVGQGTGQILGTSASDSTFLGYLAGGAVTTGQNNTFVGSTVSSLTNCNNSTALGAFSGVAGFSNSTAIGGGSSAAIPGAICTAINQIMLGRTTETVYCPGVPTTGSTTYTSLVLSGGLQLQTAYSVAPSANMLGYRIELSAISINPITSLTAVSIGSLALTVGVWSLNYTFELTAGTAVTAPAQSFYFSNASGGAYATRIANTGTTRLHFQINYGNGDNPSYSNGGTYYASSAISLYPTLLINYSGTLTGTGYASAVRIG